MLKKKKKTFKCENMSYYKGEYVKLKNTKFVVLDSRVRLWVEMRRKSLFLLIKKENDRQNRRGDVIM